MNTFQDFLVPKGRFVEFALDFEDPPVSLTADFEGRVKDYDPSRLIDMINFGVIIREEFFEVSGPDVESPEYLSARKLLDAVRNGTYVSMEAVYPKWDGFLSIKLVIRATHGLRYVLHILGNRCEMTLIDRSRPSFPVLKEKKEFVCCSEDDFLNDGEVSDTDDEICPAKEEVLSNCTILLDGCSSNPITGTVDQGDNFVDGQIVHYCAKEYRVKYENTYDLMYSPKDQLLDKVGNQVMAPQSIDPRLKGSIVEVTQAGRLVKVRNDKDFPLSSEQCSVIRESVTNEIFSKVIADAPSKSVLRPVVDLAYVVYYYKLARFLVEGKGVVNKQHFAKFALELGVYDGPAALEAYIGTLFNHKLIYDITKIEVDTVGSIARVSFEQGILKFTLPPLRGLTIAALLSELKSRQMKYTPLEMLSHMLSLGYATTYADIKWFRVRYCRQGRSRFTFHDNFAYIHTRRPCRYENPYFLQARGDLPYLSVMVDGSGNILPKRFRGPPVVIVGERYPLLPPKGEAAKLYLLYRDVREVYRDLRRRGYCTSIASLNAAIDLK